jgi:AcrR family transcriptional regulator
VTDTRIRILDAAHRAVLDVGFAGVSTRRVAEEAGVPLSQLHYHFGSKQNLTLELLDVANQRLLQRQARMYGSGEPLSKRWEQACDFLEEDLASGYVRVLQESMAAGWSDEQVAARVREVLRGWCDLLSSVASEAEKRLGRLGPFSAEELASLVVAAFLGGEALILLDADERIAPVRTALRRVGDLLRQIEDVRP